jgi:hypothetical protein
MIKNENMTDIHKLHRLLKVCKKYYNIEPTEVVLWVVVAGRGDRLKRWLKKISLLQ